MRSNPYSGIQPPTEQMRLHPPKRYFSLVDCAGPIQNYCGTIVYLWLSDRHEIWFYIDFCSRDVLVGCYWSDRCWKAGEVALTRILAYC
jgi:protoporphyrinogen oxidase